MDNQAKIQNMRDFIVYLVKNQRTQLVQALQASGVTLSNPDNTELFTVIFTQISINEALQNNLKQLMLRQAVAVNSFGSVNEFFKKSNLPVQQFSNYNGRPDPEDEDEVPQGTVPKKTAVGAFLGDLFSKDNLNKYIDAGMDALKNANTRKQIAQNIKIAELQLREKELNNPVTLPAVKNANSWVLPVVIGIGVLGIIITVIVVATGRKK